MDKIEKTHVAVPEAEITVRYLADYMAASERRRRSIIEGCKYRPLARLLQHKEATITISSALRSGTPHIVTDTQGNMVGLVVHEASIQDRDGAPCVLASIRSRYPWLRHIFADGGYAGEKLRTALKRIGEWTIEIIKRSDTAQGFEVLPRRWVVERTFAWLGRCRRLAKDFEATIASAVAWAFVAHIRTLTRRLARA
jgi:transposase